MQRDQIWRGLPVPGSIFTSVPYSLVDPREYALMRFNQNIHADISACGWQRQTGRTTRTLLRGLTQALLGNNVLVLMSHHTSPRTWEGFFDCALSHVGQDRATIKRGSSYNIRARGKLTIERISQVHHLYTGYDDILVDNEVLDFHKNHRDALIVASMRLRNDLPRRSGLEDWSGHMWSEGDMFMFPAAADTEGPMGLITEIGRVGRIPTHFSALFLGVPIVMPPAAVDVLRRPAP